MTCLACKCSSRRLDPTGTTGTAAFFDVQSTVPNLGTAAFFDVQSTVPNLGTAAFFDVQRRQFFDAEERRVAPDGNAYTKPEFRRWYGGYQEWDFAAPATHWSDSKGYHLPN